MTQEDKPQPNTYETSPIYGDSSMYYGTVNPADEMTEKEIAALLEEKPTFQVTFILVATCLLAILSLLMTGYGVGMLNPIRAPLRNCNTTKTDFFQPCIPMSDLQYTILVPIITVGGLIGSLFGGVFADWLGRRTVLTLLNAKFIVGTVLQCIFSNYWTFITGRFLIGLAGGIGSSAVPIYIAEISPDNLRGVFGSFSGISVAGGIFVVQLLGVFLSYQPGWRILIAINGGLSIFQLLFLPFCPESPRWLLSKGRVAEAEYALKRLRGTYDVNEELELFRLGIMQDKKSVGFKQLFRPTLIKPLLIGIAMHLIQQLSGVNVIFYYSTDIFISTGISDFYAKIATAGVTFINVICNVIAGPFTDRFGRRPLMITSVSIQLIFFISLTCSFIFHDSAPMAMNILSIASMAMFIVGYSIGSSGIPFLILPELFPMDVRGHYSSICFTFNFLCTFIVGIGFPPLEKYIAPYHFMPFVGILVASLLFVIIVLPETKGKSLEELGSINK